mmetsp:Transcript_28237/g.25039  ORF Transcript_28237/g.25039 Transcript_28237/m.25039 type:complete len:106 (-) Transcript_28237:336-653(-)
MLQLAAHLHPSMFSRIDQTSNYILKQLIQSIDKIFVWDGSEIKISKAFQLKHKGEDQFPKTFAFLHNQKTLQTVFNFNKPKFAQTEADYLFEKTFNEIYERNFVL